MTILDQHIDMALEVPNGIQKLRELILTRAIPYPKRIFHFFHAWVKWF